MKLRHRLTVTAVLEYDVDLEDYDTTDASRALEIDRETAEDDVYLFLDNEDTKWDIKLERIR